MEETPPGQRIKGNIMDTFEIIARSFIVAGPALIVSVAMAFQAPKLNRRWRERRAAQAAAATADHD